MSRHNIIKIVGNAILQLLLKVGGFLIDFENNIIYDETDNNNDAALSASGGGLLNADYQQLINNSALPTGNSAFSVSFLINLNTVLTTATVFLNSNGVNGSVSQGFQFGAGFSINKKIQIWADGAGVPSITAPSDLLWCTVTYDGAGAANIYLNNVFAATKATNQTSARTWALSASSSVANPSPVNLYSLQFHNKVLSLAEIATTHSNLIVSSGLLANYTFSELHGADLVCNRTGEITTLVNNYLETNRLLDSILHRNLQLGVDVYTFDADPSKIKLVALKDGVTLGLNFVGYTKIVTIVQSGYDLLEYCESKINNTIMSGANSFWSTSRNYAEIKAEGSVNKIESANKLNEIATKQI